MAMFGDPVSVRFGHSNGIGTILFENLTAIAFTFTKYSEHHSNNYLNSITENKSVKNISI